jgi:cell division protein FtsB
MQTAMLEDHRQQVLQATSRREDKIEQLTAELHALLETNTRLTREIRDVVRP